MCPTWAEWFARQLAEKGRASRQIQTGKVCGSCRRLGEHGLTCKDPWDIIDQKKFDKEPA